MKTKIISALSIIILSAALCFGLYKLPVPDTQAPKPEPYTVEITNTPTDTNEQPTETVISETVTITQPPEPSLPSSPSQTEPTSTTRIYKYSNGKDLDDEDGEDDEQTVTVSVKGPEGIIAKDSVAFNDGDTVFDATKSLLTQKGVAFRKTGTGSLVYINEIGGYAERDYGPMSGWIYEVNGNECFVGCGQYKLEESDNIEWLYSVDE